MNCGRWWYAGSGDSPYFGTTDIALGTNEYSTGCLNKRDVFRQGNLNEVNCVASGGEHRWHFWSLHPGGSHFLMADGSVQFMMYSIDMATLNALATRNGNEPVSVPN